MKYSLIPAFITLLCISQSPSQQQHSKVNQYVACTVTAKDKKVNAGGATSLLFTLTPQKGIHVNFTPPMKVTFDSASVAAVAGEPSVTKRDTLVDTSHPIVQPITLAATAPAGTAVVRGTLTYFYCSDKEGWCSRFQQPFEVKIPVVKKGG